MTEVGGVTEVGDGETTCVAEQVDLAPALQRFFTEAGSAEPGADLAATRLAGLVGLAALRRVLGDGSVAPRWGHGHQPASGRV